MDSLYERVRAIKDDMLELTGTREVGPAREHADSIG
ncbi:hypothetical protein LCGC14_3116390, partial [marine sediment metagenome]